MTEPNRERRRHFTPTQSRKPKVNYVLPSVRLVRRISSTNTWPVSQYLNLFTIQRRPSSTKGLEHTPEVTPKFILHRVHIVITRRHVWTQAGLYSRQNNNATLNCPHRTAKSDARHLIFVIWAHRQQTDPARMVTLVRSGW